MEPLLIFPFNGNGREALDCLGDRFELLGFVDDDPAKQGQQPDGTQVFGRAAFAAHPAARVLAVPGSPTSFRQRAQLIASLGVAPERFAQVVHPAACVSERAHLGRNTLLMAGVVVTSNARVEDHVCLLPNVVVHHDAVVGEYTLVGAGVTVAGGARVGPGCYLGSGARIRDGLEVGAGALVGMGSNVVRSLAAGAVAYGNPARPRGGEAR